MRLKDYLANKPAYCDHIDYGRMPRIFKEVSRYFSLPSVIHIVGTNGKGSTGRYLVKMMELAHLKVLHYTSPHILEFNERIYKNGFLISFEELEALHLKLLAILGKYEKELSYFEYSTLLALLSCEDCDYAVLEAGVGGEFDATNVVQKVLSIITPISFDHQDLLGGTIEDIARTKLASVNNLSVIAPQKYEEVIKLAKEREVVCGFDFLYVDENHIEEGVERYAKKFLLPEFLKHNLLTAYKAAFILGLSPDLEKLGALDLHGRCEKIAPNITVDVGHNIDAAKAVASHFYDKKIILIYNSYRDKDYTGVLQNIKPIVKRVELIDIENGFRPSAKYEIKEYLKLYGIECKEYKSIDKNEEYLVFGSFGVVESFLKGFQ